MNVIVLGSYVFIVSKIMRFVMISVVERIVSVGGDSFFLKIMLIRWFVIWVGLKSELIMMVVGFNLIEVSIGIIWVRVVVWVKVISVNV